MKFLNGVHQPENGFILKLTIGIISLYIRQLDSLAQSFNTNGLELLINNLCIDQIFYFLAQMIVDFHKLEHVTGKYEICDIIQVHQLLLQTCHLKVQFGHLKINFPYKKMIKCIIITCSFKLISFLQLWNSLITSRDKLW